VQIPYIFEPYAHPQLKSKHSCLSIYFSNLFATPVLHLILKLFATTFYKAIAFHSIDMIGLNDVFPSLEAAWEAIKQHVLDEGESFKTIKSDKHWFVIGCKDKDCRFCIWAAISKKEVVSITVFIPHSCSLATYYKS
jgi:MuDR family transposase